MSDVQLQFAVSVVGVVAWTIAALIDGLRAPIRAGIALIIALGMLAVSNLVVGGPLHLTEGVTLDATMMATINRAFVAAVGVVYAIKATVRLWESREGSRHGPGRDEA
jgi:xanthine/uracil/vitamin C permease (AzgA family)